MVAVTLGLQSMAAKETAQRSANRREKDEFSMVERKWKK